MGLNNEAYIVNTGTAGEIIVPVQESVQYLNVVFLGWKHYNYHAIMSQNIANLADDISILKSGGATAAAFNIEEMLAAAQVTINNKLATMDSTIVSTITTLNDEALYNITTRITHLDTVLDGTLLVPGLLSKFDTLSTTVGNSSSGIVKDIQTLQSTIGNSNNGMIFNITQLTNNVSTLAGTVGNVSSGLVKKVNDISTQIGDSSSGIVKEINTLKTYVGDINSGLVKESTTVHNALYGNGTLSGLIATVGDSNSGNVKAITDIQTALTTITTSGNIGSLVTTVGDASSGLVYLTNTLNTAVANLTTKVGDTNAGLVHDIAVLNAYDITSLNNKVFNLTDGLNVVVGNISSGLVKKVNDLTTITTTTTNNLATTNTNLATTNTNLATTNTNLATTNTNLSTLNTLVTAPTTGVISKLAAMPTTIETSLLTYVNGATTKVFTKDVFYEMYTATKAATDGNIASQFQTYFYDSVAGSYIPQSKIGLPAINAWVVDITNTGYTYLTNQLINSKFSTEPIIAQITTNKNAITKLNGNSTITDSVDFKVKALDTKLFNTDPLNLGEVARINGNSSTTNSIDYKIKLYGDTLTSPTGPITVAQNSIITATNSISTLNTKVDNITEELQIEMVRYSTILPFLQTMFKLVNTVDGTTNVEIDTIFSTIQDKLTALTTINVDYKIVWDSVLSKFKIDIQLDKDYSFTTISTIDLAHIMILDNANHSEYITLDATQLSTKTISIVMNNILYDDATGLIPTTITNPFTSGIKMQFHILNTFGVDQLITVNVS